MELVPTSPDTESLPHCKHCNRPFTPRFDRGRPQLHCTDACRLAYRKASGSGSRAGWKYRNSEAGRETRRVNKQRRQVHAASELRDPSFDRLKIFDRDGWRCQLCGQVVQVAQPTRLDSATIRLLIPVQAGGRYSFDNCETACRQCNGRAAALVAMSLSDQSFTLPRSIRLEREYDAAVQMGPLSRSGQSFGSVTATAEAAGVSLIAMSPQRPQEGV